MKRKLICMLLSVVLVLSIIVPVAAEDISKSGNQGTSRVTLDFSARNLRVTVPSVLPIDVDSDNNVTVATNASINNLSDGPVEVTNVAVDAKNGWTIVPFATDFTKVPVDTKQFGMTMYDDDVVDGVPASLFDVIEGSSQLPVRYDGAVAIQSNTIHHLDIGHVVFTVAWAEVKNNGYLDGEENFTLETNEIAPVLKVKDMGLKEAIESPDNHLFISHSISLDGNIGLFYYLNLSEEQVNSGTKVVFTWDGKINSTYEYTVRQEDRDSVSGLYKVKLSLPAAEMTMNIHACVYINGVLQDETDDYDIRTLGMSVINATEGTYKNQGKLVELITKMLNYGAKAQTKFRIKNEKPEDLANYKVDYTMEDVTGDMIDAAVALQNGSATSVDLQAFASAHGAKWYSTSLIYLDDSTLRHYFVKATDTFKPSDYKANKSNYYYYVEATGIAAAELDKWQTFKVGNDEFKYSALDFVKGMINSNSDDASKNLAKALYWYNDAANKYFDQR